VARHLEFAVRRFEEGMQQPTLRQASVDAVVVCSHSTSRLVQHFQASV
jgi:hypothetical protein